MVPPERTEGARAARRKVSVRNFYADSLTKAEQLALAEAAEVENLEDEIAVLRVRLKTALREHPEDYALLVRGMGLLTKAVATQYRLSPRASKDLSDNLAAVLNRFGDLIVPADR
ncbi:MAG: hypothetical protein ACRDHY_16590 [Anaerolineales bacterium]